MIYTPIIQQEYIAAERDTIIYPFPESKRVEREVCTPEMALLLACARRHFDPAATQTIRHILQGPVSWPRFLVLARQHRLLTCIHTELASHTDAVPDAIKAALSTDCKKYTARARLLSAELVRVLQHLSESGIKVIAYKGSVLARTLYGSTDTRHFNDIDVFIDESDLPRTRESMFSQGYHSRLEFEWEHSFFREDPGMKIMVDVHWALAHQSLRLDLPFDGVWQRRRRVEIDGQPIDTLGIEDTLIVQCINAAKDDWASLGQIFEIGQMACKYDLDWPELFRQAATVGCKRIVLIGLSLAARVFASPIPVAATEAYKSDKSIDPLTAEIAMLLIQPAEESIKFMYADRLRARSRERLRERLPHYYSMLRYLLMPNDKDHSVLSLPHLLTPLYFIIRPIRLTSTYASRIFRSGNK